MVLAVKQEVICMRTAKIMVKESIAAFTSNERTETKYGDYDDPIPRRILSHNVKET
jgi:hypothetical protein